MAERWTPSLRVQELPGGCRLLLGGHAHGAGTTLQEAADDLVRSVVASALAVRVAGGLVAPRGLGPPDHRWLDFL